MPSFTYHGHLARAQIAHTDKTAGQMSFLLEPVAQRPTISPMVAPIRQRVVIQPGGVIEIRSPDLPVGSQADVIVLVRDRAAASPISWANFIGCGHGAFKSAGEVDAHIREVRDWGDRDR